jgi:NAD+-processing family protein with receiver domain
MRPAPEGYDWVKDYDEAVRYWETKGTPHIASLDHDLWGLTPYISGVREYNGADFVQWLCGDNDRWPHEQLSIHTDYTAGRERMADMIEKFGPYTNRDVYERRYPVPDDGYGYRGFVNVYGYTYTKE